MRLGDLDKLKERAETVTLWNGDVRRFVSYETIDNAPTVAVNCKDCDGYEAGYSAGLKDAERPQGEWNITDETDEFYGRVYRCTHCGEEMLACGCRNFCTWCGADMRGEKDDK